ncbi:Basement membrane proteoglycan [Frankliniella fusca]|uniref:Basement membrane proteoglycan n=1 Tax=Frankliniella fusca TaxID=407009 RepID=A0AAE1HSA4_9NEOP|nr:Basement membrane proteoglycan [Frankliniella fusca]
MFGTVMMKMSMPWWRGCGEEIVPDFEECSYTPRTATSPHMLPLLVQQCGPLSLLPTSPAPILKNHLR